MFLPGWFVSLLGPHQHRMSQGRLLVVPWLLCEMVPHMRQEQGQGWSRHVDVSVMCSILT